MYIVGYAVFLFQTKILLLQVILDCAKRMEAQAVWAGWGHASENPKLPEELKKNNIAFIGKLCVRTMGAASYYLLGNRSF